MVNSISHLCDDLLYKSTQKMQVKSQTYKGPKTTTNTNKILMLHIIYLRLYNCNSYSNLNQIKKFKVKIIKFNGQLFIINIGSIQITLHTFDLTSLLLCPFF